MLEQWVAAGERAGASDLHLLPHHLPFLRIDGILQPIQGERIDDRQLATWLNATLNPVQQQHLLQDKEIDYALNLSGIRLRGHLFYQRLGLAAVYRYIPTAIATAKQLRLPEAALAMVECHDGLILVTGATGSGKSTTLAALLNEINQRFSRHIVTLEDPIEFLHQSCCSLIQQREIGLHSRSFHSALRAALREDPDVILLGELRDAETIRLALTAAETGHLVLASLHTRSAVQTIERLVDTFPGDERAFVRSQIASTLRGVIAQQLLRKQQGGRIAAFELMCVTPAVSNLIREGKNHQLPNLLQTGKQHGMQTLEQAIQVIREQGIALEEGREIGNDGSNG